MANTAYMYNWGTYQLKPNTRLSENSATGSLALVFDKAITDELGALITKPIFLTVATSDSGSYVQFYIAANGFTDTTHATATTRAIVGSGLDPTDTDSTLFPDVDLPAGSLVIGVISGQYTSEMQAAVQGGIATGGTSFVVGDGTASNMTYKVYDSGGTKNLFRRDRANNKAQYSNDGTNWVNMDTAAPANVTTRSTTLASANAGELFMDSADADSLNFKDAGGSRVKLVDDAAQVIPLATVQSAYAADAGASDTYVVTYSPAITAYITGMAYRFKANTANTGAASININGVGAKTILKLNDQTLENNDIEAGMIVTCVYDGTNMQMQNPPATDMSAANAATLTNASNAASLHYHKQSVVQTTRLSTTASSTQTVAHGLGTTPKYVYVIAHAQSSDRPAVPLSSHGWSDGTVNMCGYMSGEINTANVTGGNDATKCSFIKAYAGAANHSVTVAATATFDATNISLVCTMTIGTAADATFTVYYTIIAFA